MRVGNRQRGRESYGCRFCQWLFSADVNNCYFVCAESFTCGAFHAQLSANGIAAGRESFQRVLRNVCAIDSIPGWPLWRTAFFFPFSLPLSLHSWECLKSRWERELWKHTLHSTCAKHTHAGNNRAHTPLRFSILTFLLCLCVCLFHFVPFCTN